MRILHIIDSEGVYGAEVMLMNLMKAQQKQGIVPILLTFVSPSTLSPNPLAEYALAQGVIVEPVASSRFSFSQVKSIAQVCKERSIDLIHSHGYKGNILISLLFLYGLKTPKITTVHGWTKSRYFSRIGLYKILNYFSLKKLDAVVNVNHVMPTRKASYGCSVIENGLSPLKFDVGKILKDYPVDFGFCQSGFIVGVISRLSLEKGLEYLIEAITMLIPSIPGIKLIIIGDGLDKEYLIDYINKKKISDRVIITGYRQDAYNFLPLFDVFCLPSLTEGLPITLLEAMQCGVPVVASEVGGIPKLLNNGKFGYLTKPENPQSLVQAILEIKNNPDESKKVSRSASNMVLSEYSISNMTNSYIKLYESILDITS